MKKKASILFVSIILTVIVYCVSIYMQKKLIAYVPTVKCLVATTDVEAYSRVDVSNIKEVDMPISIVATTKIIQSKDELENLYLKEKLYSGQILISNQFDTKENLSIYLAEDGKEKISIKIKSPENAVSYNIKENSMINVYATLRDEYANDALANLEKYHVGRDDEGYTVVTILKNIKVIGIFDSDGKEIEDKFSDMSPDTILIAVTPEEAKKINLIRDIATFNVTEIGVRSENEHEEIVNDNAIGD